MGGSVSEASLLDRAQRTVLGMMSEREATADLSSDKVARYLQYVTHFKSIGHAMRMVRHTVMAVGIASLIDAAAMGRDYLLRPDFIVGARWEITALKEVRALTMHFDRNLSHTVGSREFSEVLAYDERLLSSLEETVGEHWTTKCLLGDGSGLGEIELTALLRDQLRSYECLHQQIGAAHRAKWATILSFMQDIVDSLRI